MPIREIILTPAQQRALDEILRGLPVGEVLVLRGIAGSGKTTILESVRAASGGTLLGMRDFMGTLRTGSPFAIEEAFVDLVEQALAVAETVIVDDLHLVSNVVACYKYPRAKLLNVALSALLADARARQKKLIFAVEDDMPALLWTRAYLSKIENFTAEDYGTLCRTHLPAEADKLDFQKIHTFAPNLNGHQLRKACAWLQREADLDTERFIEYLRTQHMVSNVEIEEVQPVDWKDLKGVDDVIRALEAKVALPFENAELSAQLGLKPKRGVLLSGPPGTGKTTIGRALAHRLKSKFFLIDGTVVAGSSDFYDTVEEIFDAAKRNAPSVVFIDDADVIFDNHEERGFYRYLLTLLDGLESAKAEKVCVMLTAMDPGSLPPAMLRSGRIELWLETRLPNEDARASIFLERIGKLPPPIGSVDIAALARASRGLTGADLKAVVEDGKLLYAHDVASERIPRGANEYFLEAIETVRANGRNYGRRRSPRLTGAVKVGFAMDELTTIAGE